MSRGTTVAPSPAQNAASASPASPRRPCSTCSASTGCPSSRRTPQRQSESAPPDTRATTGSPGSSTPCSATNPAPRSTSSEPPGIARSELDVACVRHLRAVLISRRPGPVDLGLEAGQPLLEAQAEDVLRGQLRLTAEQPKRPRPPDLAEPCEPGIARALQHLPPPRRQRQQGLPRNNG